MDEEEKLICSLVSEYSLKRVHDVIDETCIHQAEISFPLGKQEGIKEVGELLARRAGLVKGIAPISSKGILTNLEIETLRSGEMIENGN